nr:PLDc N-terminal domain-containing protein [Flexivirga oryzae]
MALPVIVLGALLVAYCLADIARADHALLVRRWQWALAVLLLIPIGPVAYLLFEKLGPSPGGPPQQNLSTHAGGNTYLRGEQPPPT